MLSDSMMNNKNTLIANKTIKYSPANSVLKYEIGDDIKLTEDSFIQLSYVIFSDIESKYV